MRDSKNFSIRQTFVDDKLRNMFLIENKFVSVKIQPVFQMFFPLHNTDQFYFSFITRFLLHPDSKSLPTA